MPLPLTSAARSSRLTGAQQPADRRAIVGGARRARAPSKRRLLSAAFNSLPSNWQDGKLPNYHG